MRARKQPHLYLRGSTWWCYWRDDRWSTKTADRAQAERAVRQRYDPRFSAAREASIEDAIRLLYEALDRRERTEATKKNARDKLGHFARLWEAKALADISFDSVLEYIRIRTKEDEVKRITVSHELGYLRQAWKLATARGWTTRTWQELMPERFDHDHKPRDRWLTIHEVALVMNDLSDEHAKFVAWIVATGCDVGDIERAIAGDVDWKKKLVRVRGTKNHFRDRLVPITALTQPLLEFCGGPPPPWKWCNLSLRRCAKRLGISHFTPKDLRRTHGYWLRNAGVDPHLIGSVMGHADSKMADTRYAVGAAEALAELVRARIARCTNERTDVVRNDVGSGGKGGPVIH